MSGSRRENAYVNFTKKIHFCTFCTDFFVNVFYSALLNRMRADFSFSDNLSQKM